VTELQVFEVARVTVKLVALVSMWTQP